MRLSMQVFLDELRADIIENRVKEKATELLVSPRLFSKQFLEAITPEYIYVGKQDDIYDFRKNRNFSSIIYTGNRSIEEMDFYEGIDVIRVKSAPTQIFLKIQQTFEKYNKWDERLLDAVMSRLSLQAITDIGAEVFPNPLAVFDSSLYCLATGGRLPDENTRNPIWFSVLHRSHPINKNARVNAFKKFGRQYGSKEETVFIKQIEVDGAPPYDILSSYIFDNGIRLANIGMTEIWEPITQGQVFLCEHLAKRLKSWFLISQEATPDEPVKQVIRNLLQGYPVPKELIDQNVNWMKKRKHQFYLMCINWNSVDDAGFNYENDFRFVKRTIENRRRFNEIILEYDRNILLILCADSNENVLERIDIIEQSLEPAVNHLLIGVSDAFEEFKNIRTAYLQAVAAVEVGKKTGKKKICRFPEHALKHMLFTYLQNQSEEIFCARDIKQLYSFDQANKTEYIKTLKTYYQCDANMTKAAKLLNIHRNSMTYRMEKILEILEKESISDICEGDKLYAAMSCELVSLMLL